MTTRRASGPDVGAEPTGEPAALPSAVSARSAVPAALERTPSPPRSHEEAQAQYVAARDAWTAAMRRANSGRTAHMASLAITQEAYEAAAAELERWRSGARVAIRIDPEPPHRVVENAVGHELAWRGLLHPAEKRPGLLGRLRRRLTRRG
jgi:hypothetical protein